MTAQPFFTIVVATHLRAMLLERALRSLQAQTSRDFETIVVSDVWDAATLSACAAALGPDDQILKRAGPCGPARSRNAGLDLARGAWVIFLDDDDTLAPHHVETMGAHARVSAAPAIFSDFDLVTEDRAEPGVPQLERRRLPLDKADVARLWIQNFIPSHALAFRRAALADLRVDPHMASLEDWEFLLSVCEQGAPVYVPGGGAVVHKDFENPGTRRGSSAAAKDGNVVLDTLYAYRRRPAPSAALREGRIALLASAGMSVPADWL